MTRKRLPQSDYDARYDVVRALLTVTARDTRKGVRVAHRLNPQPKGTVDGRREQAKRVAALLMRVWPVTELVDPAKLSAFLRVTSTPELLRIVRDEGDAGLRSRVEPAGNTVREHFARVYQPSLGGAGEWRSRELSMLSRHVFSHVPAGRGLELGQVPPGELTNADARSVKVHLATMARDEQISRKYAAEIWRSWRAYAWALCSHDSPSIRIREDFVCEKVDPIETGGKPERQWLFPDEAWSIWEARTTPVEWAQAYAGQIFLALRPGELRALTAAEVRLDQGLVRVWRKMIWDSKVRGWVVQDYTKSKRVRWVQIPEVLRPLLEMLVRLRPTGPLFCYAGEHHLSKVLRKHALAAEVDRPELHHVHAGSIRLRAHDLRATGATWHYLAGCSEDDVRRRLGHTDKEMTSSYLRDRAAVAMHFGNPLARALPARLLTDRVRVGLPQSSVESSGQIGRTETIQQESSGESFAPAVGLEPENPPPTGAKLPESLPGSASPSPSQKVPDDSPDAPEDPEGDSDHATASPLPAAARARTERLEGLVDLDPSARPGLAICRALELAYMPSTPESQAAIARHIGDALDALGGEPEPVPDAQVGRAVGS